MRLHVNGAKTVYLYRTLLQRVSLTSAGLGRFRYMIISIQRCGQFRYLTTSIHMRSISVHMAYVLWNICAKTAEPIECHLGCGLGWAQKLCIRWGSRSPWEEAILRLKGMSQADMHGTLPVCRKRAITAQPIEIPFEL